MGGKQTDSVYRYRGEQTDSKRERMERYLEWLLTPKAHRQPSTKSELADDLGITPQTLRNYDKDAWLQKEFQRRKLGLVKSESLGDVMDTLISIATDKDAKNAVSAAREIRAWLESDAGEGQAVDLSNMTTEELRDLAFALLENSEDNDA